MTAAKPLKAIFRKPLALAPLALLLTNCMVEDFGYQSRGDGYAVTETRSLSAFSRVDLECPIHVTIKTGSQYAAYVTSDGNLSAFIQTDAFAGVLTIGLTGTIDPVVVPEVVVVVPDLREVIHDGSGLVDIVEGGEQGSGDFPDLKLQLNGNGEIHFSGTASNLRIELNGAGRITLEGFAASLQTDLRGEGDVFGENLLVEDADVNLSGAGNVYLDLDYQSTLNLDLPGSGRVEWWGAPEQLHYNLTGQGKVVEHRGLPKKSAAEKKSSGTSGAATSATSGAGNVNGNQGPKVKSDSAYAPRA